MTEKQKVGCLLASIALLLSPVSAILKGLVLRILWGWFIVPLTNLPPLTIPMALGVSLVVSFLTYQYAKQPENTDEDQVTALLKSLLMSFFQPAIVLLFGWIYHLFVR